MPNKYRKLDYIGAKAVKSGEKLVFFYYSLQIVGVSNFLSIYLV